MNMNIGRVIPVPEIPLVVWLKYPNRLGELGDVSLLRPFIETIGTDVNVPRLMLSSLKKLESESNLLAEEACFVNTLAVHTEDDDVHDVAREVRHDTAKLRIHKHTADASLRAQIPLAQFQN